MVGCKNNCGRELIDLRGSENNGGYEFIAVKEIRHHENHENNETRIYNLLFEQAPEGATAYSRGPSKMMDPVVSKMSFPIAYFKPRSDDLEIDLESDESKELSHVVLNFQTSDFR